VIAAATLGALTATPAQSQDEPVSDVAPGLHRAPDVQPPEPEAARSLIEQFLDRLRTGALDAAWLRRHLAPPTHATGPDPRWIDRWLVRLSPDRPVGRTLRDEASPIVTLAGPNYQRVLLGPPPALSAVVVAGPHGPALAELSWTTCALCSEPARFVADLLDDVTRRGRLGGRLLPGVELDVTAMTRQAGSDWVGMLVQHHTAGGRLATALRGAHVCGEEGATIQVCLEGGVVDTWQVSWEAGRYRVDYDALAPDSPVRMSRREEIRWRAPGRGRSVALDDWEPSFASIGPEIGLDIGYGAVDAWFDPRDGTVLILLMDLDRVLAGIARVDPQTRQVVERWPLALVDDRARLDIDDWASLWLGELSDDGRHLAIHSPGRIWRIALESRSANMLGRGRASFVGWAASTDGDPDLLVGRPDGLWVFRGVNPLSRMRLPSPVLAAWSREDEGAAVCENGSVLQLPEDSTSDRVCCGRVADAAVLPAQGTLLAACAAPCDVAATLLRAGADPVDLPGAGSDLFGAAISPDGRWITTGQASPDGSLILWSVQEGRPVARLPVGPVRRARFSPDGSTVLTIEAEGRVSWWPLAATLRTLGL